MPAVSKKDEFCMKNEELCRTNEEFSIQNDDFLQMALRNASNRRARMVRGHTRKVTLEITLHTQSRPGNHITPGGIPDGLRGGGFNCSGAFAAGAEHTG